MKRERAARSFARCIVGGGEALGGAEVGGISCGWSCESAKLRRRPLEVGNTSNRLGDAGREMVGLRKWCCGVSMACGLKMRSWSRGKYVWTRLNAVRRPESTRSAV